MLVCLLACWLDDTLAVGVSPDKQTGSGRGFSVFSTFQFIFQGII